MRLLFLTSLGGYVVQGVGEHGEGGSVLLVIVDGEPNDMLYIVKTI